MDTTRIEVRSAEPSEASALTELAMRAKAHHGYDEAFMAAVRPILTVSPEKIENQPVFVLEEGGAVAAFYILRPRDAVDVELDFLFVEPSAIGRGFGRLLWDHAVAYARSLGHRTLLIESDPYAEPFYRARGAVRVGDVPSTAAAKRALPLLHFDLTAD